MYKIIPAEERHLNQILPLLASTGYWDFGLKNNLLNISNRQFMLEAVAKPHLPYTSIIVKPEDDSHVLGVIVCTSNKELAEMPASDYDNYINPRIAELFKNLFTFQLTESYHISFLAVSKPYRGQGLGTKLIEFAEEKAKDAGYETLSLYTFSCQTSSIKLYLKMGMMVTKVISVSERLPFPYLLYFEKNKKLSSSHDYFETEAYEKLNLDQIMNEKA